MSPSPFDINGEQYQKDLLKLLWGKLTQEELATRAGIEEIVWDTIEEDMSGYVSMLTDLLTNLIWAEKLQLDRELQSLLPIIKESKNDR